MANFQSRLAIAAILGSMQGGGLGQLSPLKPSSTTVPPSEPERDSPLKFDSPIEVTTVTCNGCSKKESLSHQNMQEDSSMELMTSQEDKEFANNVLFLIQLMGVDVMTSLSAYTTLTLWSRSKRLKRERDRGETTQLTKAEEKRLRKQQKRIQS